MTTEEIQHSQAEDEGPAGGPGAPTSLFALEVTFLFFVDFATQIDTSVCRELRDLRRETYN